MKIVYNRKRDEEISNKETYIANFIKIAIGVILVHIGYKACSNILIETILVCLGFIILTLEVKVNTNKS